MLEVHAPLRFGITCYEYLFVESSMPGDSIVLDMHEIARVRQLFVDWVAKVQAKHKKTKDAEFLKELDHINRISYARGAREILVKRRVT